MVALMQSRKEDPVIAPANYFMFPQRSIRLTFEKSIGLIASVTMSAASAMWPLCITIKPFRLSSRILGICLLYQNHQIIVDKHRSETSYSCGQVDVVVYRKMKGLIQWGNGWVSIQCSLFSLFYIYTSSLSQPNSILVKKLAV